MCACCERGCRGGTSHGTRLPRVLKDLVPSVILSWWCSAMLFLSVSALGAHTTVGLPTGYKVGEKQCRHKNTASNEDLALLSSRHPGRLSFSGPHHPPFPSRFVQTPVTLAWDCCFSMFSLFTCCVFLPVKVVCLSLAGTEHVRVFPSQLVDSSLPVVQKGFRTK